MHYTSLVGIRWFRKLPFRLWSVLV